jgi:predicted acyltransferase
MSPSPRFLALDVFRGMTICFMIIVNTSGNGDTTFAPLMHASWHGFTPTDLVFPSFLFAVGNAMSFVMLKWAGLPQSTVLWKILKRTALIFLLGYLLYWFPFVHHTEENGWELNPISHTRILGVLQRIALCYGIASLMIYYLKPKWVMAITLLILVAYKFILDGYGDLTMVGNAGQKLDIWLMGENHLYHGEGIAFDPEGWLSTLPAIGNVVFGYFAGRYIQQKSRTDGKIVLGKTYEGLTHLLLAGVVLIFLAYCWNMSFPVNKKLWTSSFVLLTVGLDLVILSTVIYIVDFLHKTKWTYFFQVFGKNPLFIYLLSEVGITLLWMIPVGDMQLPGWLYQHVFSLTGAYTGALLYAVCWMLTCWVVGWWMDRKKIYVRV